MLINLIYIITQDIRMFPIAGQTAGPNGIKFVVDSHVTKAISNLFLLFLPRATPGPLASIKI